MVPTLPPNHALKNFTALELSRFIDKRLTNMENSKINPDRASTLNALDLADD